MARSSEHETQRAYFQWARLHKEARRAFAIPNGGARSKATAGRLKAEGVRAGVLDVFLPLPRGECAGMWVEFKHGYNKPTDLQEAEIGALVEAGYAVLICWGAIAAIEMTETYLRGELKPGRYDFRPVKPAAKARASAALRA